MKTNKLGIPIVGNINIEGHAIKRFKYKYNNAISYYRDFLTSKPVIYIMYGINIYKQYKHEKK